MNYFLTFVILSFILSSCCDNSKLVKYNSPTNDTSVDNLKGHLNNFLVARLDSMYADDQNYRLQVDSIQKQYGWESIEMKNLWRIINGDYGQSLPVFQRKVYRA